MQGSSVQMVTCKSYLSSIHEEVRPHLPSGTKVSDAYVLGDGYGKYTFTFNGRSEFVNAHCAYCARVKGWEIWMEDKEEETNLLEQPATNKEIVQKQVDKDELIDTLIHMGHNRELEWKVYAGEKGDRNTVACVAHCEAMKAKVVSSKFDDVNKDIKAFMRDLEKKAIKDGSSLKEYLTKNYGIQPLLKGFG